jgi:CheY-like chemotaxis protein
VLLETVDLEQLIRDTVQFHMSGSNVATHFDIPGNLWPLKADKGQFAQVLSNLVLNAKEAMPKGGNVYVRAENVPLSGHHAEPAISGHFVKLTIRDEGSGIPKSIMESIFDPYFTTKPTGSGLGLAIVHGIVSRHKGHIQVDSMPNAGTTFTLLLPADTAAQGRSQAAPAPSAQPLPENTGRILLMDDEEMIRIATSRMLERLGYTVDLAIDGRQALDKYAAAMKNCRPYDLAIMDLTIPGGMGGREAMQALKSLDPKAKAIVYSGYSSDPVLADYARYGFSGCLAKPFMLKELQREITRVLQAAA